MELRARRAGSLEKNSGLWLRNTSIPGHLIVLDPWAKYSGLILFFPSDPNQGFQLATPHQKPDGKGAHGCCPYTSVSRS